MHKFTKCKISGPKTQLVMRLTCDSAGVRRGSYFQAQALHLSLRTR